MTMTTMKTHYFTKMCKFAFIGCDNLECNYAHTPAECKYGLDYATKGVEFVEPLVVLESFLPRFIVKLNDDDDDDDDDMPPSSMSLSQLMTIQETEEYKQTQKAYLPLRLHQLSNQRLWTMVREYNKLTMTYGEQDMEFSDEEMDCE